MNGSVPKTEHYTARLAGRELVWAFRFPETKRFLKKWISGSAEERKDAVHVSDEEFADWAGYGNTIDGFAEFCLLCQQTSEALLPAGRCVIHAAAVRFRDRAFLIAAGSGVGKSTQVRTLMELYPEEVTIINGDKPILECRENGDVIVHSSPWNGKEGWCGAEAAPLAGIFVLRRGEKNDLMPLTPQAAAPHIYLSIFQSWHNEDIMRRVGDLADKILSSSPVWLLTNKGVPDSTRLMYDIMKREAVKYGI